MGERWIQECMDYLEQIGKNQAAEGTDRLELVRSMQVALLGLNHSVWGWLQYVNNPDIMGKFTREELSEINDHLNRAAAEFIEYDVKITKSGMEKGLREAKQQQQGTQLFYV
jgi:hypothetical protein